MNCKDQKFAFTLLDGQMMQWLLDTDGFDRARGRRAVGDARAATSSNPRHWLELGDLARRVPHAHPAGRVYDLSAPVVA